MFWDASALLNREPLTAEHSAPRALAISCTSCVQVMVFLGQSGLLEHCRVCKLQIPGRLRLSWFEPTPGSHLLFSISCEFSVYELRTDG
jgi:hypothetical protein